MKIVLATMVALFTAYAFAAQADTSGASLPNEQLPVVASDVSVDEPSAPTSQVGLGEVVGGLIDAIKSGKWLIVAAFAMMLVVWIVRLVWKALPAASLPWVSAAASILGAVGYSLYSGDSLMDAIQSGLIVSLSANGLWSLVGKRFDKIRVKVSKKHDEPKDEG